ncbi:MAG TPA: hypothetical protein VF155_05705 [Candidatus Dormibacteraeota bacterium]
MGPDSARAIAGFARLSPLGHVSIRGRKETVDAFRLHGLGAPGAREIDQPEEVNGVTRS